MTEPDNAAEAARTRDRARRMQRLLETIGAEAAAVSDDAAAQLFGRIYLRFLIALATGSLNDLSHTVSPMARTIRVPVERLLECGRWGVVLVGDGDDLVIQVIDRTEAAKPGVTLVPPTPPSGSN